MDHVFHGPFGKPIEVKGFDDLATVYARWPDL